MPGRHSSTLVVWTADTVRRSLYTHALVLTKDPDDDVGHIYYDALRITETHFFGVCPLITEHLSLLGWLRSVPRELLALRNPAVESLWQLADAINDPTGGLAVVPMPRTSGEEVTPPTEGTGRRGAARPLSYSAHSHCGSSHQPLCRYSSGNVSTRHNGG